MAEWLGNGLQNRLQRFDSAWYLRISPAFQVGLLCVLMEGVGGRLTNSYILIRDGRGQKKQRCAGRRIAVFVVVSMNIGGIIRTR